MKTWNDVVDAALNCPVRHMAVTHVRAGNATREEALIAAVLYLSKVRQQHFDREAKRLSGEPLPAEGVISIDEFF